MSASYAFGLVLARTAGFAFRAPGVSHPSVPPPVRAGLAYAMSLAIAAPFASVAEPPDGITAIASFGVEALIGSVMGAAASALYDGAYSGGRALDDYVGIRASVPSANVAAGAGFGRLWSLAFSTGFFVLGADALTFIAFADSFRTLGPGAVVANGGLATIAIALPSTVARAALLVAGPALALALVLQLALATLARVVPRFSTFSLAFGVVYGGVLLATVAALPLVLQQAAVPWFDFSALHR